MASAGRILMFPVGDWIQGNDYGILDIVYHEGSSYIAKANIINSITPPKEDTTNWQIHARGFGADALSEISATDTSGMLGTAGADVVSQALIDAIADRVMTKLIPYANIANNFLATDPNTVLSGPMGKSLKEQLDNLNSNLTNLSKAVTYTLPIGVGMVAAYTVQPTNIYTIPQSTLDTYNVLGAIILNSVAETSSEYVLTVKLQDNVVQLMTDKTQNYIIDIGLLAQKK